MKDVEPAPEGLAEGMSVREVLIEFGVEPDDLADGIPFWRGRARGGTRAARRGRDETRKSFVHEPKRNPCSKPKVKLD